MERAASARRVPLRLQGGLLGAWLGLPGRGVPSCIFGHGTRTLA